MYISLSVPLFKVCATTAAAAAVAITAAVASASASAATFAAARIVDTLGFSTDHISTHHADDRGATSSTVAA